MDGDSKAVVADKLKAMGYAPLTLEEVKTTGLSREISIGGRHKRVKAQGPVGFSRQFATMVNSGLSLLRALSILEEQTQNPTWPQRSPKVRADVEGGAALSGAMAKHPMSSRRS